MRKRDPPHKIQIHLEHSSTKQTVTVKHGHCSCIAGKKGSCNHCFTTLSLISHCTMCGFNSVPEFSCTMLPQKWHMPRSIMKPEPVMQSARLNPLEGRSGKRETAVKCTLYEAQRNQASVRQETRDIVRQRLININPKSHLSTYWSLLQVKISKHNLEVFQMALCALMKCLIWNQDLRF